MPPSTLKLVLTILSTASVPSPDLEAELNPVTLSESRVSMLLAAMLNTVPGLTDTVGTISCEPELTMRLAVTEMGPLPMILYPPSPLSNVRFWAYTA